MRKASRRRQPGLAYTAGVRSLRLVDESDADFRQRAERAANIARILIDANFANACVRSYIDDPALPMYTEASVRQSPTVRVEFEQALGIGGIGETLAATQSKSWGDGPWIMPLQPDDWFDPHRITYLYRENSLYNRRFEQRRRLKELLGRRWRPLVETAKRQTKSIFLEYLTTEEAAAIRRILKLAPGQFWRACKGTSVDLPPRLVQRLLPFDEESRTR